MYHFDLLSEYAASSPGRRRARSLVKIPAVVLTSLLIALLAFAPLAVSAQQLASVRSGVTSPSDLTPGKEPPAPTAVPRSVDPLTVTLASAVIPGAGQLLLRQKRAAAYLALEAGALAFYLSQTRDGRRQRDRYRAISRDVARARFNPNGPRGDWDYYERMGKFVASGEYDLVPGGGLDPEINEESYNGSVWLLARQTYWRDPDVAPDPGSPEHSAAMAFYEQRAVAPDMRWSWIGEPQAFHQFRSAIDGSNSAFRSASATASILLANHFLSAVDAYVSVQIRVRRNSAESIFLTGSLPIRY